MKNKRCQLEGSQKFVLFRFVEIQQAYEKLSQIKKTRKVLFSKLEFLRLNQIFLSPFLLNQLWSKFMVRGICILVRMRLGEERKLCSQRQKLLWRRFGFL